ncbi:transcription initiation factor TFIID subunit 15-like isoform X3 [Musa acuminata AAA Group]|uniref:transcription initiation factor TFIID subunit 15-like isoform X3 n=1 Tax=Musa acuminata AAA Group TaxID=214697 RepID=UPI0031D62ED0
MAERWLLDVSKYKVFGMTMLDLLVLVEQVLLVVEGGAVVVVILGNVPIMLVVLWGSLVQMTGPVQFVLFNRGGCAGGYKELDEEEMEETRRRWREADEDDGEIYDEFGNLKKKFRAKTQQAESGQMVPGSGRAGWEVDETVMTGRHGMDKSRDRYRDSNKRESSKNREIDGPERERRCSRSREKERECEKERGRVSDTEHLVQKMLVIGSSA